MCDVNVHVCQCVEKYVVSMSAQQVYCRLKQAGRGVLTPISIHRVHAHQLTRKAMGLHTQTHGLIATTTRLYMHPAHLSIKKSAQCVACMVQLHFFAYGSDL
jgi:endonuclease/exonuclease/phosphatase family metal-dependent hydrolase